MHQNFTKLSPSFFRSGLVLMFTFLFAFSNTMGQTYTNGNLITGTTATNGTTAPAGYSFSEMQPGATNLGFGASIAASLTIADDFTVPQGEGWSVSTMVFYAYSTAYPAGNANSPFTDIRIKIYNTDPSVGSPTPIWGDATTNRLASSANAFIYRTAATTPDLSRKVWSITANTPVTLGPGTYWVEFQTGTTQTSNFMPPSTIVGSLTLPGYNAYQHNLTTNAWTPLLDGSSRMDMPFKVNYTACTPPTVVITSTGGCSPSTLTASGADAYTWSPANGLNTTTGATVTASPVGTATYTVTGTSGGCVGTASVTITNPFTSATLVGAAPEEVLINESFNDSLPAGWISINNSDVPGALTAWTQGSATVFPAHTGAPDAYILANYQMTTGEVISAWMLTPEVSIQNGDKISFWTRTTDGTYPDRLELRMSTAGASSNVGTTPTSVGDFSTLLLSVNPDLLDGDAYPSEWTQFTAVISGLATPVTGKFGFRYFVTNAGPDGDNSDLIGIDDIVFSRPLGCVPAGSTQNISVNITGGASPYTVVYFDGTSNVTVPNYTSGANIPVTPNGTTTYTLVSVESNGGCSGTNIGGSYTFQGGASITTQPNETTSVCGAGPATITVGAEGTGLTYQWQVSTDGGTTFTNIVDGPNYTGTTSATLTLQNVTGDMNGYIYHVNVTGASCPGATTSSNSTLAVAATTVITTQPTNNSTCAGQTVTFNVVSNGVTFQWQQSADGGVTFTDIPQENSSTLTVVAVNNAQIRVIIGNGCGINTTSDVATLTVSAGAAITTQPAATTAVCGSTDAVISVVVSGTEVTYQWQVSTDNGATFTNVTDGANYSGSTSTTLTVIAPTESMSGYIYHVNITSGCGVITSNGSTLNVAAQTTITGQPENNSVCEGSTATYTVVSNGSTFQWQVSTDGGTTFTDIAGATSATYVTAPATFSMNGDNYRVIVGGCGASITSNNAEFNVRNVATISSQPVSTSVCDGQSASFAVTASSDAMEYQWQVSTDGGVTFTNIDQATASTLDVTATGALNNNQYQVLINNGCGNITTSTAATLTVTAATVITAQPTSATICAGADATFTVTATGNNLSYQWNEVSGTSTTPIAGATSASYTVTGATAAMNGNVYFVVVSSTCGNLNSENATLTVNSPTPVSVESQTGCEGSTIVFTATGGGGGTTLQWQVSIDNGVTFTDIPGETSTSLVLPNITLDLNSNIYRVVGTGSCGSSTSEPATLTVIPSPVVDVDGPEGPVCAGSSITLTGTGASTYTFDNGVTSGVAFTINNTTTYTVTGDTGGCSGTATFTVTVNPVPTVVLTSTATDLSVGETATITATSTPTATTFEWFKDGVLIPGSTGNTIVVTYDNPGVYTASVDLDGCSGTSNAITINAIAVNPFYSFITPNPNNGVFKVNYPNTGKLTATRVVSIFDSKGSLVYLKSFPVNAANPIEVMDVNISEFQAGAYHLLLSDGNAKRLKTASFIKK